MVSSAETVRWFQTTEQELADSFLRGDKTAWERVLDPKSMGTSEEGQMTDKQQVLDGLRPLPPGVAGGFAVNELTVQEFSEFAVVRYVADGWQSVFGQMLATKYRITHSFRRDGASWRLVASHVSVVTQDPPPQTVSSAAWPNFVGTYQLLPGGWTLTVELRDGKLYGGRDPKALKPLIPLAPDAFTLSGSLGEWIFVTDANGRATRIVAIRKTQALVWTRVESKPAA